MSKSSPIGAVDRSAPLRAILAVLLAFSGLLATLSPAFAEEAHAAQTAKLTVGSSIYYGGYSTNWMWADGEIAYCGDPSASTPASGTYESRASDAPVRTHRRGRGGPVVRIRRPGLRCLHVAGVGGTTGRR